MREKEGFSEVGHIFIYRMNKCRQCIYVCTSYFDALY